MPRQLTEFKTIEELKEGIRDENPALAEALSGALGVSSGGGTLPSLQESDVDRLIAAKLEERDRVHAAEIEALQEATAAEIAEGLEEARAFGKLEEHAHRTIRKAGLPPTWTADLTRAYSIGPSGVPAKLRVQESAEQTAEQVLEARIEADVKHARQLLMEADADPRVSGLGARRVTAESGQSLFAEFMSESSGEEFTEDKMIKMIQEGVA